MRQLQLAIALAMLVSCGGPAAAAKDDADARCLRLEQRVAELRLKLRMGYTARQGRIYRQKLAALESERRAWCRG